MSPSLQRCDIFHVSCSEELRSSFRKCKGGMELAGKEKHPKDSSGQNEDEKLFHEWLGKLDSAEISLKNEQEPRDFKRTGGGNIILDLHGCTVAAAMNKLEGCIESILTQNRDVELKVITGKGIRSVGPPVLAREAWDFVVNRYHSRISRIDSCPADTLLGGIPIRGYFVVVFKR